MRLQTRRCTKRNRRGVTKFAIARARSVGTVWPTLVAARIVRGMPINADKPHLWKQDIAASVDQFNKWFMKFAPKAYRDTRVQTTKDVERTLCLLGI